MTWLLTPNQPLRTIFSCPWRTAPLHGGWHSGTSVRHCLPVPAERTKVRSGSRRTLSRMKDILRRGKTVTFVNEPEFLHELQAYMRREDTVGDFVLGMT